MIQPTTPKYWACTGGQTGSSYETTGSSRGGVRGEGFTSWMMTIQYVVKKRTAYSIASIVYRNRRDSHTSHSTLFDDVINFHHPGCGTVELMAGKKMNALARSSVYSVPPFPFFFSPPFFPCFLVPYLFSLFSFFVYTFSYKKNG